MDRYSAPLRVVLNIATLKAYVIHNWAKSEFDLMQMSWRNLGSSEICFCVKPACSVFILLGDLIIRWLNEAAWMASNPFREIE